MIREVGASSLVGGAVLCVLFSATAGQACRYSVRDLGFVAREDEPTRVVVSGSNRSHRAEAASRIRDRLRDAGIEPTVYADDGGEGELRADLLRGDDRLRLASGGADAFDLAAAAFEALRPTERVDGLTEELVERSCLVVVLLAPDRGRNDRTRGAVNEATRLAVDEADLWEKPMSGEPAVVVFEPADVARERVTLWSLGFDPESLVPQAAVVYGRWRRLGPVLTGDEITPTRVAGLIGLLGRDCECDLSRGVFVGPSAPHTWTAELAARSRALLGFDPEHPMTVIEARQILASKPGREPEDGLGTRDTFLGYQEIDLAAAFSAPADRGDERPASAGGEGSPSRPTAEENGPAEARPAATVPSLGALASAVVAVAAFSCFFGWRFTRSAG